MVGTSLGIYYVTGSLFVVASVSWLTFRYVVYKIKYTYDPFEDQKCIFQEKEVHYLDCGKKQNETRGT